MQATNTTTNDTSNTTTSNSSNVTNSSNTSNASNTSNQSTVSSNHDYSLYIYPSDNLEIDVIGKILTANHYAPATLMSWILGNVTGMPNILNISDLIEIDRTPPILNEIKLKLNVTDNTIIIKEVSVSKKGFLYMAVEPVRSDLSNYFSNLTNNETLFKSLPNNTINQTVLEYANQYLKQNLSFVSWVQIRNAINSTGDKNSIPSQKFVFNSSLEIVNTNFTNLSSNTYYMISVYATADDPSYFGERSETINWIQKTAEVQRLTLAAGKIEVNVILMVLFVLIFVVNF